jgi:aminomethyltransferase
MALKKTALIEEHLRMGGRLVDFGGWELPVQYAGVAAEHEACRTGAGLFDVSHMGEISLEGKGSAAFLDYAVTNSIANLAIQQAQYTAMCLKSGGIVDDLVIYRRGSEKFLLVVNASNTEKDFQHLLQLQTAWKEQHPESSHFQLVNESALTTQIALQGPQAEAILQSLTSTPLKTIKTYWFVEGEVAKIPTLIARTGYTGEDGFELYIPWDKGPELWRALEAAGAPHGLKPCGLGARDTLRLEMKYPLYGHELTEETLPLETGLSWVVKLNKPDFCGKTALVQAKTEGRIQKTLAGLKLLDRGIARQNYPVYSSPTEGAASIGSVTSGSHSPSLKQSIAIASLPSALAKVGTIVWIGIRDQKVRAEIVPTPFYQRPTQKGDAP